MAYFFQILELKKEDISDLNLTDVVTEAQVTMVCDHLGARRLRTTDISVPRPTTAEGFIAFSSLTEEQVTAWIEASLGAEAITEMKTELEAECNNCMNKSTATVTPPWVTSSGE